MTRAGRQVRRTLAVAGVAAASVWPLTAVAEAIDGQLHAGWAAALAGDSATQGVVLVDAAGAPGPALAAAIAGDGPRLVLDVEGWTGCGIRLADGTCAIAQVPGDRSAQTGLWVRPGSPVFAALIAIGAGREAPFAIHYARRLPTVPAGRVVAGDIPTGTFAGRVAVVGRADPAAASVATPLGPMSPAQVEAQALLGVLDGAARAGLPGWARALGVCLGAIGAAALVRRRGLAGVFLAIVAAVLVDAGVYMGGVAAGLVGAWIVAALVAGAVEVGLRAATGARRAEADGLATARASGSGLASQSSRPDQVSEL